MLFFFLGGRGGEEIFSVFLLNFFNPLRFCESFCARGVELVEESKWSK